MGRTSGHKAKIDIDVGQTASFVELEQVTDSSVEKLIDLLESSEYGDDGERRTPGRVDFTLDATVNLDLGLSSHQDLYGALRDGTLVDVEVTPDRDTAANKITATCYCGTGSSDLGGGDVETEDFSFENADGSKWAFETA